MRRYRKSLVGCSPCRAAPERRGVAPFTPRRAFPSEEHRSHHARTDGPALATLRGSREGWANGFHAVRERNPISSVRHAPRNCTCSCRRQARALTSRRHHVIDVEFDHAALPTPCHAPHRLHHRVALQKVNKLTRCARTVLPKVVRKRRHGRQSRLLCKSASARRR